MRKLILFCTQLCILFSLIAAPIEGLAKENHPSTKLFVKYKETPSKKSNYDDTKIHVEVIEVPLQEKNQLLKEIKKNPKVEFIEEEREYSFLGEINDSFYQEYQLKDFNLIQAKYAWEKYKPKGEPVVAVIDSGIDLNHPDLSKMIVNPYNAISHNSNLVDEIGHGTHVAGIVGAETNNYEGIASLGRNTLIMPIKVGGQDGISSTDVAAGILYAVDHGADIINISIGGPYSMAVESACNYAYENGVLVIAAAGNNSSDRKLYPAAFNNVLAVASVDSEYDKLSTFSNFGDWVSVSAPGTQIYSTYLNSEYKYMDGTSMASPMTASLAALLKNHAPFLTHNQIRSIIEESSDDYDGSSKHENGRINALKAINLTETHERIYGQTSVETSIEIADRGWERVPSIKLQPKDISRNSNLLQRQGNFAILSSNQSFPDSLAASALAYGLDAPILLTNPSILKHNTVEELKKLGVNHVIILGGKAAISEKVEMELIVKGYDVLRIEGEDRYKTAVNINNYVAEAGGTVIITNGKSFSDSLSISSFASKKQVPIVFVDKGFIPEETKNFLRKYGFKEIIIVGGPDVISKEVENSLRIEKLVRIAGANRYETNIKIIEYFKDEVEGYLISTGMKFQDALSGGVLSAKLNSPLILTEKDKIPEPTKKYLEDAISGEEQLSINFLGGPEAISIPTAWKIDQIVFENFYEKMYGF